CHVRARDTAAQTGCAGGGRRAAPCGRLLPARGTGPGPGPGTDGGAGSRGRDLRGAGLPGRHRQDPARRGLLSRAARPPRGGGPGLGERRPPGSRGERVRPGGGPRRPRPGGRRRGRGGGRGPLRVVAAPDPAAMVLDDLADPGDLRELWPDGPAGRVLITTRLPAAAFASTTEAAAFAGTAA